VEAVGVPLTTEEAELTRALSAAHVVTASRLLHRSSAGGAVDGGLSDDSEAVLYTLLLRLPVGAAGDGGRMGVGVVKAELKATLLAPHGGTQPRAFLLVVAPWA